jgi:feruloyl esterase
MRDIVTKHEIAGIDQPRGLSGPKRPSPSPRLLKAMLATTCLGAAVLFANGAHAATTDCAALMDLPIEGRIISAAAEPAGPFTPPAGGFGSQTFELPAHCKVQGVLTPTPDSEITFEVWMPATGWNGRFQGIGNGGFAGDIGYAGLAGAILGGYAAATTDTGHTGGGAQWAVGHPEKVVDFGSRAIHLTAVIGQELVAAYYGAPAEWSYFASCSNGGRQALMEAQRYPEDYDGIIAMAPAHNWTGLFMNFVWNQQILSAPGAAIPAAKTPAIAAAVVASCDNLDGLPDGLLADPRLCRFDPAELRCSGEETDTCLTEPQVAALRALHRGPRTSDGQMLYYGFPPGGEAAPGSPGWDAWIFGVAPGASIQGSFGTDFMKYIVGGGEAWTPADFDVDRDSGAITANFGPILNADDPNLASFAARGGKLILVHGWSDAAIPAQGTIDYYESVQRELGSAQADEFTRLYLVPGMHHCGGGAGPSDLGGGGVPRLPKDPVSDLSAALEEWVEQGRAPAAMIARQAPALGSPATSAPVRTGLICPYPERAVLNPGGSVTDAADYSCALQ